MIFVAGTSRGDEVWVASKDRGITVIRPTSWTRYRAGTTGLPQNDVNGLAYSAPDGLFWAGMATQCVASVDVDNSVWTHLTSVHGFESNLVSGVAVRDASGTDELWVGAQTGLSVRRGTAVNNYIKGSGLPAERVRVLVSDKNGEIWACFIGAGAGRVDQYELRNQ
jgi:ligand-binding sensor domain-containing protein